MDPRYRIFWFLRDIWFLHRFRHIFRMLIDTVLSRNLFFLLRRRNLWFFHHLLRRNIPMYIPDVFTAMLWHFRFHRFFLLLGCCSLVRQYPEAFLPGMGPCIVLIEQAMHNIEEISICDIHRRLSEHLDHDPFCFLVKHQIHSAFPVTPAAGRADHLCQVFWFHN